MSTMFRKAGAGQQPHVRKKVHVVPAKSKADETKTPITRVGEGLNHQDAFATNVLRVLVDKSTDPVGVVELYQYSKMLGSESTANAEPLSDTDLVFALTFEHIADKGKVTLKYYPCFQWGIYLFKDIDVNDLFLMDPGVFLAASQQADEAPARRTFNYYPFPMRPDPEDQDLYPPDPPLVSLMESADDPNNTVKRTPEPPKTSASGPPMDPAVEAYGQNKTRPAIPLQSGDASSPGNSGDR